MSQQGRREKRGGRSNPSWINKAVLFLKQGSLRKTLVLLVLFVSLVPVVLVGSVSYFRTRSQIQSLVTNQLYQISSTSVNQMQEFAQSKQAALNQILDNTVFRISLEVITNPETPTSDAAVATLNLRDTLIKAAQAPDGSESVFTHLFAVDEAGNVLTTTDSQFISDNFGQGPISNQAITRNFGKETNTLVLNPFPATPNGLVMIASQPFSITGKNYTLIGVASTTIYPRILSQAAAFLPGARAFLINQDGIVLGNSSNSILNPMPAHESFVRAVKPVMDGTQTLQPITFSSYDEQVVLAYVNAVPDQNYFLVLQVPVTSIFAQAPFLDGFTIYMLVLLMVVLAAVTFFGTNSIASPLITLTKTANQFAQGKLNERVEITRSDEIGQLAASMNKMAEDLSSVYASLEKQVEDRTSQLRAASEVAQLATSSSNLDEIIHQTVNLVTERFDLYNSVIYLIDETHRYLILRGSAKESDAELKRRNIRLPINQDTLPGLCGESISPQVVLDITGHPKYLASLYQPYTRSVACFPISTGGDLLGVLEVSSAQQNGIGPDLQFALLTISNQIAGALQNIRLFESTKIDLEETSLLYRITRLVISSTDEAQAMNHVIDNFHLLPHTAALLTLDGGTLHINALYDPRTRKMERGLTSIDIPASRMMEALSQGVPIYLNDITLPSEFDNIISFFLRRGCRSAVISPAMCNGKPVRVLVIGFMEDQTVNQATLQPYINLSEVIGATLEKFTILETLQQRLAELQLLATFSQATTAETNLNQLFVTLYRLITDTLGENLGFLVGLYREERESIEFPYASENGQILHLNPIPLGAGLTSFIIQNRKPLLLTTEVERRAVELGARIVGRPARSWMGVPLIVSGKLIGALVLQDQDQENRFSENDLSLVMTLAPQIATTIRNAQLLDEMQSSLASYEQDRVTLNTWLSNTPDAIIIKDADGTYLRASQSVAATYGVRPEMLIGKSDFDFLSQEAASLIYTADRSAIQAGVPQIGDIEEFNYTGETTWDLVSRIPVRDLDNKITGVMVIRRNITDIKRAEEMAHKREDQIRTTAEIARDSAGILDFDELLSKAVNLVRERFGFYHASIFLLDPMKEYAVLRESTGEAGLQMKRNRHRLAVGSRSIVGQATHLSEAVIVHDVTKDPTHLPNPLLPDTRAELALPLIFAGNVIGALDVQSIHENAFTPGDIEILGILADQLAAAIHNAELYARAQQMLGKHRLLHKINLAATTSQSLQEALQKVTDDLLDSGIADHTGLFLLTPRQELELAASSGYLSNERPSLLVPAGKGIIGAALQSRQPVRIDNVLLDSRYIATNTFTRSELALPVEFADDVIGVLNLESNSTAAFSENDMEIMAALANNLGAVVANWRLVEQIRKQVDRQKNLFETTNRIRRSIDINTILETSVREIGSAVGAKRAVITLTNSQSAQPPEESPVRPVKGNGSNGHGNGKDE